MTIKVFVILIQDIKINTFFSKTKVQEREFVHILLINSLKYTEISILYRLFKNLQHLDLPELKSNDFYLSF